MAKFSVRTKKKKADMSDHEYRAHIERMKQKVKASYKRVLSKKNERDCKEVNE